ncbi:hypothetical protein [Desulfosporosinus sp. OT]|uniref:hypothetical protein n=1 Tax=Desulfosporosinus sp. OT TaxID=913865 RepID=UPI0011118C49|nr:hypothetical protein [Desulfosporosinus sp. OT]
MFKLKLRHILTGLGVIVVVIGGYVGWQVYQGQQMANQYASDTQQSAQTSGSKGTTSGDSPDSTSPSSTTPNPADSSSTSSAQTPSSSGLSGNSSTSAPSATSSSGDYKQLMTQTYQQALQTMRNVKENTLALQGKKLSLSTYKSSILQAQATLTTAEEFVKANPPTEEKLTPSYQKFLAGISLAKDSMGVVLKGISSFSPSKLYAAREMGKQAQQQVIDGYSHF